MIGRCVKLPKRKNPLLPRVPQTVCDAHGRWIRQVMLAQMNVTRAAHELVVFCQTCFCGTLI